MQMHQNNFKVYLSFSMCKIGVVGSSFSVGCHHNPKTGENNLALPFETWLKKYVPNTEFYNSASSGKGSELYLNKIVYLKDRFDIDILLMELVNNRSMLNVKSQQYDLNNISDDIYENSSSIWDYMRGITQRIDYKNWCTEKEFNTWKKVQERIAYDNLAFEFWGILDCKQAIKLCKMLNIRVVTWQKSFDFRKYITPTVQFDDYDNAHSFYQNKYGDDKILCDEAHFNDKTNDEMVRDYIAPELRKAKRQVDIEKITEGYSVGG